MCGIHGIISYNLSKEEIKYRLKEMGKLQQHRGPDDRRETAFPLKNGYIGMGFVRLSILDLDTGMQPIICKRDNSAIICNGQVYNYIELKPQTAGEAFKTKGDIEVALHLYRKLGLDFLQKLNGMYAGAIFDSVKNKIILFRDRFGIKPLYYTQYGGNFIFSSEIKPLLKGSELPGRINEKRLGAYFTYRFLPGEETMFQGVKLLPPGSYLEYDLAAKTYFIKRYWEYTFENKETKCTIDEASEEFHSLFTDAVRIRLRSDVEVGSLISGGIDSSAVASKSAEYKPGIKLFTMSFNEEKYNELPQVRQFMKLNSNKFGSTELNSKLCGKEMLNLLPDIVYSLEEPLSLGTIIPTDQVCQLAGDKLKVVLTGEGADEIFAGYRKFLVETAAHEYDNIPAANRSRLLKIYPELESYRSVRDKDPAKRYIQSEMLFNKEELSELLGRNDINKEFPNDALPKLNGNEHPLNAAILFETRSRLPDYVILRLDKLSMRHSLETRTPFLDYRLAEFAATLPVNLKVDVNNDLEKYICRYSFSKFSVLDKETSYRKKQPFTIPIADWFTNPGLLPEFLQDILLGDIIKKQGVLNQEFVRRYAASVSPKGVGPETLVSGADRIFAIVIFTIWYSQFMES